jgi:exopolyphosphatase/guanosine-5'-triphosphate,3'-diphosphate pyrophosphatase
MMLNQIGAVVDMGTNTFNLLVFRISGEENFEILHSEVVSFGIGKLIFNKGELPKAAIDSIVSQLSIFQKKAVSLGAAFFYAVGTSAVRNCLNQNQLKEEIEKKTLFQLDIISGAKEADYIYLGLKAAQVMDDQPSLMLDIGGGSCEWALMKGGKLHWSQSIEMGMVRLSLEHEITDPITQDNIQILNELIELKTNESLTIVQDFSPTTLIGVAGSFETIAIQHDVGLLQSMNVLFRNHDLNRNQSVSLIDQLTELSYDERLKLPGIPVIRAQYLPYALVLIKWVLQKVESIESLRITTWSLKEGYAKALCSHLE